MTSENNSSAGSSVVSGKLLYLQVAQALKEEILSGVYLVGSRLPTEGNLRERFGVSRHTIREALRLLRDDGLVASRQGAGTVVVPARSTAEGAHHVMSINDLVAWASGTRFEIESVQNVVVSHQLAARTGLPEGEEWLEVAGFRYSEEQESSICWTEYYIYRGFAAVSRLLRNYNGPIFPLIEDMFGQRIDEVHQQVSATLATAEFAAKLGVDEGSAALEVRRTYTASDGQVAQVTINTHPASRFQHSMTMRRLKA